MVGQIIIIYLNDILVFSNDQAHVEYLRKTLPKPPFVKPEECQFDWDTEFLDYIIFPQRAGHGTL